MIFKSARPIETRPLSNAGISEIKELPNDKRQKKRFKKK